MAAAAAAAGLFIVHLIRLLQGHHMLLWSEMAAQCTLEVTRPWGTKGVIVVLLLLQPSEADVVRMQAELVVRQTAEVVVEVFETE